MSIPQGVSELSVKEKMNSVLAAEVNYKSKDAFNEQEQLINKIILGYVLQSIEKQKYNKYATTSKHNIKSDNLPATAAHSVHSNNVKIEAVSTNLNESQNVDILTDKVEHQIQKKSSMNSLLQIIMDVSAQMQAGMKDLYAKMPELKQRIMSKKNPEQIKNDRNNRIDTPKNKSSDALLSIATKEMDKIHKYTVKIDVDGRDQTEKQEFVGRFADEKKISRLNSNPKPNRILK